MVEALGAALDEALERDPAVIRLDATIAETGAVGLAVGLCLAGYRPVVEIPVDAFAQQIATHVAPSGRRPAPMRMVIRVPFGGDSPAAPFCRLPGLRVVCPSTPDDAFRLMRWAIASDDPVVLMEPKRLDRALRAPLPGVEDVLGDVPARVVRAGTDVTVVTYGGAVPICSAAAAAAAEHGVSAEVIDLRSLWPLDARAVIESVVRTHRCAIVHEAPPSCGIGAEVAALLGEHALPALEAPIARIAGPDLPRPERIADAIVRVVNA